MWSLYSQPLFYSLLFYAIFFNVPWHCLPCISLCCVIFSLTLLLVLCFYANPLYLMGIIFSPSPLYSFSLPYGFSFFLFFLFIYCAPFMPWTVASCSGFIVPQSTPRQLDFLSPFLLLHATLTLLARMTVSENFHHLHHSLCTCGRKCSWHSSWTAWSLKMGETG